MNWIDCTALIVLFFFFFIGKHEWIYTYWVLWDLTVWKWMKLILILEFCYSIPITRNYICNICRSLQGVPFFLMHGVVILGELDRNIIFDYSFSKLSLIQILFKCLVPTKCLKNRVESFQIFNITIFHNVSKWLIMYVQSLPPP